MKKSFFLMGFFMPILLFAQQIPKQTSTSGGEKIGFLEYKPANYNVNTFTRYPIIIFLHGIGERGNGTTELNRVKNIGIPHYINSGSKMRFYWNGKWETFLVLSPQCPMKYGMWPTSYVDALISYAEKNLRIDKNRIFLTGLSMGGGGTWKFASKSLANAKKLAAIATVCAPPTLTDGCNIAKAGLPMWSFHATNDKTVNISSLTNAINKVNACSPAIPAKKTVWTWGDHSIWDMAYDMQHKYQNPNVFEWFLSQGRQSVSNKSPIANAGPGITTDKPETIILNGSASKDPDGWITKYSWKKISGPSGAAITSATSATTKVSGIKAAGTYKFELQVTDNSGAFSKATVTANIIAKGDISKTAANAKPLARITGKLLITAPVNSATLSAATSFDKDGWISKFKWIRISGPAGYRIASPDARQTIITNLQPGSYIFRVTVTDNKGAEALTEATINVNGYPKINAGPDMIIIAPDNYAFLSGHRSTDAGGWITHYRWTKISGPNVYLTMKGNTSQASLRNLVPGKYVMRLIGTDNNGATASDDMLLTVQSAPKTNVKISSAISSQEEALISAALAKKQENPAMSPEPIAANFAAAVTNAEDIEISISPNPATNNIHIRCRTPLEGNISIMIYDFAGRPVKSRAVQKNESLLSTNIDISTLVKGTYIAVISKNNKRVGVGKFVKKM